jgi:hypothetical protein
MGLGIFWGNKLKWHFLRNKPHDKYIHIYRETQLLSVQKLAKLNIGTMAYSTAILNVKIVHFPINAGIEAVTWILKKCNISTITKY